MELPLIRLLPPVSLLPFLLFHGSRPRGALMGIWAAYIPALELKLLHSVGRRVHSVARSALPREAAGDMQDPGAHWARAFATPVTRHAAENWVMHARLHHAGLAPKPLALSLASRYRAWFSRGTTVSAGLHLANLPRYPLKAPSTEAEVIAAGVLPDASRACLREQINGWVSDLNNARSAMPVDAEEEVAPLAAALDVALGKAGGRLSGLSPHDPARSP